MIMRVMKSVILWCAALYGLCSAKMLERSVTPRVKICTRHLHSAEAVYLKYLSSGCEALACKQAGQSADTFAHAPGCSFAEFATMSLVLKDPALPAKVQPDACAD